MHFRERFQINGEMIPPRTLAALTGKVLAACERLQEKGLPCPVEFEAVTAIALLWFAAEKCDLVVLETGLGGRYDATNAIPAPLVAAITKIGLITPNCWGIPLRRSPPKKQVSSRRGARSSAIQTSPRKRWARCWPRRPKRTQPSRTPELRDIQTLKSRPLQNYIDYGGYRVMLPFPGRHQANHAAMAIEIALLLWRRYGYEIADEAIEAGLREAKMPARIEILRRRPLLLLDGCHNPDGAAALAATLTEAGMRAASSVCSACWPTSATKRC